MAMRLPSRGSCAFCKHGRLSVLSPALRQPRKKLHTESTSPVQDYPHFSKNKPSCAAPSYAAPLKHSDMDGPALSDDVTDHQLSLDSPVDLVRESVQNDATFRLRRKDLRGAVLQSINGLDALGRPTEQDPQPQDTTSRPRTARQKAPAAPYEGPPFPMNGEALPHELFRQALLSQGHGRSKPIRHIMREQFLRCQMPREILRVIAVAMFKPETAREMENMHHCIIRALYRSRNNVTDERILGTINVIVMRLKKAKLHVNTELLNMGLKFAARARSLSGMKRYLKEFREQNSRITRAVFRTVIAKFSIGKRGLGEIRNGRWRRQELLQVLLGFEDTPADQAYHLGSFLVRSDWQYLHGWVAVLARCRAADHIWQEWEYWLESAGRKNPRPLQSIGKNITTKVRGDYWFVEQMCYAGDMERAWIVLKESGIEFSDLRPVVKAMMMEQPEHIKTWNEDVKQSMLDKYAAELDKIERALGLRWVMGMHQGPGYHVLERDMEETFEKLADAAYSRPEPAYGYPWDDMNEEDREMQRKLHEAEEVQSVTTGT